MEFGVAPKAFRIPISLVLSLTVIIMILLIPTTPAIKVMMPMIQTKALIPVKMLLKRANS